LSKIDHVNKKLDLATIAARADLPIRTLRYVIDHELVPNLRVEHGGRGNARFLALFDATVLCCAATLLDYGVTQTRVRQMMRQYRGAKRTSHSSSFWAGLQQKSNHWHFGFPFIQVTLHVGMIHLDLQEGEV